MYEVLTYELIFPLNANSNDRVGIIKALRQLTGMGLKEAVDTVNAGSFKTRLPSADPAVTTLRRYGVMICESSKVQRFSLADGGYQPAAEGEYVQYSAYRELEQRLASLKAQVKALVD